MTVVAKSRPAARRALARARPLVVRRSEKRKLMPLVRHGYGYEAAEVARACVAGLLESPSMTLDDTIKAMAVMDAIRLGRQAVLRTDGGLRADVRSAVCLGDLGPDDVVEGQQRGGGERAARTPMASDRAQRSPCVM